MVIKKTKSLFLLHQDIGDDAVPTTVEVVDVPSDRADWLDRKIAAVQNRRDRQLTGITGIAEAILETAYGHVRKLTDRVVHALGARVFELSLSHPEELAGTMPGESNVQIQVDQPIGIANESDCSDDMWPRIAGQRRLHRPNLIQVIAGNRRKHRIPTEHCLEHVTDSTSDIIANEGVGNLLGGRHGGGLERMQAPRAIGPFGRRFNKK